jgi:hypothetical protein
MPLTGLMITVYNTFPFMSIMFFGFYDDTDIYAWWMNRLPLVRKTLLNREAFFIYAAV